MIKGIGIDLVELKRIKQSMDKHAKFVDRILTRKERACLHKLGGDKRKVEYLAGRFAAKEAYAKAYGTGLGKLGFHDIEILNNEYGAPSITGKIHPKTRVFVSITHTREYAQAQVIIEVI